MTPDLRKALASCWRDVVERSRDSSVAAQENAKASLVARGLAVHVPSEAEIDRARAFLLGKEREIAARLSVSDEALGLLEEAFRSGDGR